MKYTITCGGEHKYPLGKPYEMLSPNCSFTVEMDEEEVKKAGGMDNVVQGLRTKVENYLDGQNPDIKDSSLPLPF